MTSSLKTRAPGWLRPPAELNDYGRRFWKSHARRLFDAGRLAEDDVPLFVLLAISYGQALEAQAKIEAEGLFRQDENGVTRRHPAVQVQRDASAAFSRIGQHFGLSPRVRRVDKIMDGDGAGDELDKFLERKAARRKLAAEVVSNADEWEE